MYIKEIKKKKKKSRQAQNMMIPSYIDHEVWDMQAVTHGPTSISVIAN